MTSPRSGGKVLADQLRILGADTFFCVPGESFLGLLDGLYDHEDAIRVITCRHESGATNMADAHAKMTGKPGICAVTRGPGATNGSNGVHTAFQDSTPMILFIGQVSAKMMDREAFQEIDYRRMFGEMAKWVAQIEDPQRIPEYIARAWSLCQAGRPGPVVLALPENVLSAEVVVPDIGPVSAPLTAPTASSITRTRTLLGQSSAPMMVVGGPGWSKRCHELAGRVAETFELPVATSFRCQDYFDNAHPNYVGPVGIAPRSGLGKAIREETDLLLAVGPRFGEITTQGFTLIDVPTPQMKMVHVHPGPDELGHIYAPELKIPSAPDQFFEALLADGPITSKPRKARVGDLHAAFEEFRVPVSTPGDLNMSQVVRHMSDVMPPDTIFTNGAGNYSVWLHRFHAHCGYRTQLAPTSGSMGYGVPAAIAAKLHSPGREVVCVAGDGCFLMTAQELATAAQYELPIIYLVVNNGMYGTIRMHQEREHPRRTISTTLRNPDFAIYASAFGIPGETVRRTQDFPAALERARTSDTGYLIDLIVDPESITPTQSLSEIRAAAEGNS